MFGFFGRSQYNRIFTGSGTAVGSVRFFGIGLGSDIANFNVRERTIFDENNVGIQPQNKYNNSFGFVSNTGNTYFNKATITKAIFSGSNFGITISTGVNYYYYNNSYIGYAFSANTALSPLTRSYRLLVSRPDMVEMISTNVINGAGGSVANNTISGATTWDLTKFPNLKYLSFSNVGFYSNPVTIIPNRKLEGFYISDNILTTLNGKLPSTVKTINFGSQLTSVNTFIEDCVNCELLTFGHPAGGYNGLTNGTGTLSGALNASHMTNLKVFTLPQNNSLTSLNLPTGNTNWTWVHLANFSASVRSSFNSAVLNSMLVSPNLKVFYFPANGYAWNKNITNSEISTGLTTFYSANNSISGDCTITATRSNMLELTTGIQTRTGSQLNSHPNVNVSGLTNCRSITMMGCNISNIQLPTTNTLCQTLQLGDNKIDIGTNPNLLTQVNTMTGLVTLRFSIAQTSTAGAVGQNSTNGLGTSPSFSSLVNLTTLGVSNCKILGTLTLPSSTNKIVTIEAFGNTGLTSIANFNNHLTSIGAIRAENCNSLNLQLSGLTNYSNFIAAHWQNSIVDISNRTATSQFNTTGGIAFSSFPNLHTIKLPASASNFTFAGQGIHFISNPQLTGITNLSSVGMSAAGISVNVYNNSSLNISFPFSATFRPFFINVSSNNMSQANVDTTIDNIYSIRNTYAAGGKSLNIGGTNSTPSGTYQAPSGYVQANGITVGNDGTPASGKEKIYVLVNQNIDNTTTKKYNWTVSYTP